MNPMFNREKFGLVCRKTETKYITFQSYLRRAQSLKKNGKMTLKLSFFAKNRESGQKIK